MFAPRAQMYLKNASSGTYPLNRDFKGFGALSAYSVPLGETVTAILLPPNGPRAGTPANPQGNPYRVQLTVSGAATDVVVTEM